MSATPQIHFDEAAAHRQSFDLNRALLTCLLKVRARRGTPLEIGPTAPRPDLFAPTLDDKIAELQAALSETPQQREVAR